MSLFTVIKYSIPAGEIQESWVYSLPKDIRIKWAKAPWLSTGVAYETDPDGAAEYIIHELTWATEKDLVEIKSALLKVLLEYDE